MSKPIGTVKIIRVRFLEDEVYDGGIPQTCYDNSVVEEHECEDVEEAVRVIQREGLTFAATGTDWAAHPDGSQITDYATAEREDATAHLVGFLPSEELAVIYAVG